MRRQDGCHEKGLLRSWSSGKRIQQLNSAFASSQQFHQTLEDFQSWLAQQLQDQAQPQSVSARLELLHQALKEHGDLQKTLKEQEEPYATLLREGEALLQGTDGAEKMALQGQLSTLRSNWEEVKRRQREKKKEKYVARKIQKMLENQL